MQKIGDITSTANANGEWTEGNPAAGLDATLIKSGWLNTIQRELIAIVLGAGITLNTNDDSQVLKAIKALAEKGTAASAKKLETPREINGVPFDGSANIAIGDNSKLPLAGGKLSGSAMFEFSQMAGAIGAWQDRIPAVQINCPRNTEAYAVWKGTNWSDRHLASMDVYAGGTNSTVPSVMLHVGDTTAALLLDGGGNLSIKGSYSGDASKLTGLDAGSLARGTVPAARLAGPYNITAANATNATNATNAESAKKLAVARSINGVPFDGTQNIAIGDNSKLPLTGGVMVAPATFDFAGLGGAYIDWRVRSPAVQVNAPSNNAGYMIWRATNWNDRHLAAMEAYAGGGSNTAQVAVHVGSTTSAMTLSEGGNLSIQGTFNGNASGLTNLPRATASVPGAVLKNTAFLDASGWWKCAETGMIKQWGYTLGASDSVTHRSFPIAFPNRCFSLVATRTSLFYSDTATGTNALIVSNSQFSVISGPFATPDEIYWEATGN